MANGSDRRPRSKAKRVVTAIHKWIGLGSALLVIVISGTGLLLNHGPELKLDETPADAPWLLNWYGLNPEGEPRAFVADGHWMVEWDGEFFFDGESAGSEGRLAGAGMLKGEFVAVFDETGLIFDDSGQLLEKLDSLGVAGVEGHPAMRAGVAGDELVIEVSSGVWVLPNLRDVAPLGDREVAWFEPAELPADARVEVELAYRGEGLPLSRVILDLHSGRIFGRLGVLLWDLAAIAFLVLAGTGLWLGLRKRRNQNRQENP